MCVSKSEKLYLTKDEIDEEMVQRVCLSLEYSDPGRILALVRSLFEKSNTLLQKKINRYLQSAIKCQCSFMILSVRNTDAYKVSVIGKKVLPLGIMLKETGPLTEKLRNLTQPMNLELEDLDEHLLIELASYVIDMNYVKVPREIENCIVYPVLHPVSGRPVYYVVLVNYEMEIDYERKNQGLVTECMRYCMGILVNSIGFEEEKNAHDKCRSFIEVIRSMLLNIANSKEMIHQISLGACDMTCAERCAIFLADGCGDLVSKVVNYGNKMELNNPPFNKIKLSGKAGIAASAVRNGQMINSLDTQNDPLHNTDLDNQMGFVTKNLLSFPLRAQQEVYGVMEVYNKIDWKYFTEEDEEAIEVLGSISGPIIKHSLEYKKIKEKMERVELVHSLFLPSVPLDADVHEVLTCEEQHYHSKFMDFSFSQMALPNSHIKCMVYRIFTKLGLIRQFDISPGALARFIITIFLENTNSLFFNWRHTFGTFHFASLLVNNLNLVSENHLTLIEVLSFLLAALCHQFAPYEANTPFQVTPGTNLAALYASHDLIDKKYSCSRVFMLMSQNDCQILENIPADQFKVVVHLIQTLMEATDMAVHMKNLPKMQEVLQANFDHSKIENRILFLSLLMSCSEMNDYVKHFKHCRDVSELTYYEFFRQGDLSSAEGIFDLSVFEQNISIIPHLQSHFIKTYCIPTFKVLSILFPVTYVCLQKAESNLDKWSKYEEHFEWTRNHDQVEADEDPGSKDNDTLM